MCRQTRQADVAATMRPARSGAASGSGARWAGSQNEDGPTSWATASFAALRPRFLRVTRLAMTHVRFTDLTPHGDRLSWRIRWERHRSQARVMRLFRRELAALRRCNAGVVPPDLAAVLSDAALLTSGRVVASDGTVRVPPAAARETWPLLTPSAERSAAVGARDAAMD